MDTCREIEILFCDALYRSLMMEILCQLNIGIEKYFLMHLWKDGVLNPGELPFDKFIIAKTPAARRGTPEGLKGPAVFLSSNASDYVNGYILYVDGSILAYIGKQP